MTDRGDSRGGSAGRRPGRNTTHEAEAYASELGDALADFMGEGAGLDSGRARPASRMEPDATGMAVAEGMDGFHQPTAMFDKGELLGELADELAEYAPDTRAAVEVDSGPRGCKLIIVAGPDLGMEWGFKQAEIMIGRGSDNQLDFSDIAVSRHHAKIILNGDHFVLEDLGSNNGTLLNGVRVDTEQLFSGDEIVVGARTLRFVELLEAPPTAAAHPIADPEPEPVAGSPSEILEAVGDNLQRAASQLDIDIVPDAEGPSEDGSDVDFGNVAPGGARPRRTGLKVVALGLLSLVVLGGLFYMAREVYYRVTGDSPEARMQRARVNFLQGVELVKQLRCGDAIILFDSVLEVRPEYNRAKEYKAYCLAEIEVFQLLEEIQTMAGQGRYREALARLSEISEDSRYAAQADGLSRIYARRIADGKVKEARELFSAGALDDALEILAEVLTQYPRHKAALALQKAIRAAKKPGVKPVVKKRPEIPPLMVRAVTLYRKGRILAAIDAAEAAGGPDAVTYVARMRRMKKLVDDAERAHTKKAGREILKVVPSALELDRKIALGQGELRRRLKDIYADGLYLKGLEAFTGRELGKAFRLFSQAVSNKPGHRLAQTRLADIKRKAQELYYEGDSVKTSNPARTRLLFRRVVEMTARSNQFHKWAAKWLSTHRG